MDRVNSSAALFCIVKLWPCEQASIPLVVKGFWTSTFHFWNRGLPLSKIYI